MHVIMSVEHIHELGVVRSLLEANGIRTFVNNEYSSQLLPYRTLGNNVNLLVSIEDVSKAISLLEENNLYNENVKKEPNDNDYLDSVFTEWTIFGNYKPVRNWFLFIAVVLLLVVMIAYALMGH